MKRVLPVVGLLAIVGIAGFLLYGHGRTSPATKPSPRSAGSGSARTATVPGTDHAPAHVDVTVTDAKGPLGGAAVRFAGPGGDVVVAKAGGDGIAHVDGLAPGSWTVSASAPDHVPAAAKPRELHAGETAAIAIALPLGGRALTGTVTDASGGPVSGARVDAARLDGLAKPADAVASTTTGTDGRYRLTIGDGHATVAVNHPDYAPQQRYVEISETGATADFQLVPGGVIEGEVRDESKAPVAGARVVASRDQTMSFGEAAAHRVTAGPDGHFRITGLRPGAYSLEASLGPLYSHAPTVVGLGVAEQVTDVVILVGKGAAIHGVVVDEHDAPVPGVEVSTFGNREYGGDKSDAKGAFVVAGLSPGRYELVGRAEDYISTGTTAVDVATKDVDNIRVGVRRAGHVKGHVEPRQVCEVRIDDDDDLMAARTHGMPIMIAPQETAADGEFALGPVQPTPYVVTARCPSGDQGSKQVQVAPGMADITVDVKPGASIAGRVVDGHGKPIASATVNAAPLTQGERTTIVNGMMTSGSAAMTSATGAFELKGLSAATYRLRVLDRGRPLPMKADVKLAIGATDHKTGVELVVDRPDGVIKGTVIGPDGKPLADAWVSVEQSFEDMLQGLHGDGGDGGGAGESRMITIDNSDGGESNVIAPVLTDASGHFEISGLPRTPWRVVAEAQAGKLRGHADAVKPDATIAITIAGISELHGQVHVDGTPPPWFAVELDGPTGAQRTFGWTDGSFAFGRVDPGDYTVRVTSAAGNGEAQVKVGATAGAPVQITLASNAIVTGKLVDKDGKPVPDVGVVCVPDQGPGRLQISVSAPPPRTGPDGGFRVETKAGTVVVAAMTPGAPTMKRGVVLQAGQTVDVGPLVVDAKPPPK